MKKQSWFVMCKLNKILNVFVECFPRPSSTECLHLYYRSNMMIAVLSHSEKTAQFEGSLKQNHDHGL